jgi:CBS-domain-containing membrane protein
MPRKIDKSKLDAATTNYLCLKKLLARCTPLHPPSCAAAVSVVHDTSD